MGLSFGWVGVRVLVDVGVCLVGAGRDSCGCGSSFLWVVVLLVGLGVLFLCLTPIQVYCTHKFVRMLKIPSSSRPYS